MRIRTVLVIAMVSALSCAPPAAASVGWCMRSIPGKDHTQIPGNYNTTYASYVSGVIDFGPHDERQKAIERQFGASVGVSDGVNCLTGSDDAGSVAYYRDEFMKKGLGQHVDTGWTGGFAANGSSKAKSASSGTALAPNEVSISFGGSKTKATPQRPAQNKYVEVQGPDGSMRLSPEVAARNEAAADEYRRKMEEHASAKTDHERKLALHQQSIASAAAERREHERRLAANAAEVAAHQAALLEHRKLAAKPPGVNAVYRGFTGPTCEIARRSALFGSGTSKGTKFAEVTQDLSRMPQVCIVQGWSWNTSRTGSSRQ